MTGFEPGRAKSATTNVVNLWLQQPCVVCSKCATATRPCVSASATRASTGSPQKALRWQSASSHLPSRLVTLQRCRAWITKPYAAAMRPHRRLLPQPQPKSSQSGARRGQLTMTLMLQWLRPWPLQTQSLPTATGAHSILAHAVWQAASRRTCMLPALALQPHTGALQLSRRKLQRQLAARSQTQLPSPNVRCVSCSVCRLQAHVLAAFQPICMHTILQADVNSVTQYYVIKGLAWCGHLRWRSCMQASSACRQAAHAPEPGSRRRTRARCKAPQHHGTHA